MSEMNVAALAEEYINSFNVGAWKRQHDTMSPDARYQEFATQLDVRSSDEIIEVARAWKQAFQDLKATVTSLASSSNTAIAELKWRGTHTGFLEGTTTRVPAFGNRLILPAVLTFTGDAAIDEIRHYFDLRSFLTQVGAVSGKSWEILKPIPPAQKWHVWAQTGWAS
jgi:steroid delta-isomerase-like uncharacterized protein